MKPDVVVDFPHVRGRDLDRRPLLSILVVAIGHDGIQAVVAAVELDDDQDAAFRRGLLDRRPWRPPSGPGTAGPPARRPAVRTSRGPGGSFRGEWGACVRSLSSELELGAIGKELKRLAQADRAVVAGGLEYEPAGVFAQVVLKQKIDQGLRDPVGIDLVSRGPFHRIKRRRCRSRRGPR